MKWKKIKEQDRWIYSNNLGADILFLSCSDSSKPVGCIFSCGSLSFHYGLMTQDTLESVRYHYVIVPLGVKSDKRNAKMACEKALQKYL